MKGNTSEYKNLTQLKLFFGGKTRTISGYRCGVNKIFAVLGCYSAWVGGLYRLFGLIFKDRAFQEGILLLFLGMLGSSKWGICVFPKRLYISTNVRWVISQNQVRGFKPGRSRRIFQGEKILSTPSFGREIKPFVPYRRFAACKRSLNFRGSRAFSGKIHRPFLSQVVSSFHY